MKGIYISNLDPVKAKGYKTKILGQINGFNKLGIDIDLICLSSGRKILLNQYFSTELETKETILSYFYDNILLKRIALYKNSLKVIQQSQPNFLYLRHPRSDPLYLKFLECVKKNNSDLKIISEIPTFPYDHEYINCNNLKDRLLISLDKLTRSQLKKYIDLIVVIAYEDNVFGIPSLNLTNGIDTSSIKPIVNTKSIDKEINLIGVGNIDFWHGFDRVILGLYEYYQNQNTIKINFNIVSPPRKTVHQLQELTLKLNLSDYITFHGALNGIELNDLYEKCHLAIGTIANHRINLNILSPLKSREYAARGIPFICSYKDPDFHDDFPYCLTISANDMAIDISSIIEFFDFCSRENEYNKVIREYAERYLDWSIKLKQILDYID